MSRIIQIELDSSISDHETELIFTEVRNTIDDSMKALRIVHKGRIYKSPTFSIGRFTSYQ